MKTFRFFTENRKHKIITREQFQERLDSGEKFTQAGLYEPEHAPKGTEFLHVKMSPSITRFLRARGQDHPIGPGVIHKNSGK